MALSFTTWRPQQPAFHSHSGHNSSLLQTTRCSGRRVVDAYSCAISKIISSSSCQHIEHTDHQQQIQQQQQHRQQQQQQPMTLPSSIACSARHMLTAVAAVCLSMQLHVCVGTAGAAELVESSVQSEGNVPSELSAAGEQQGPRLSSLVQGKNKKEIEGCTRRCVPTCIRGGEGSPGLGPITLRKEIIAFKDGFRSRPYCLSECTQVCALLSQQQQQQQPQQQRP